jgi:hypothetical protein
MAATAANAAVCVARVWWFVFFFNLPPVLMRACHEKRTQKMAGRRMAKIRHSHEAKYDGAAAYGAGCRGDTPQTIQASVG